MKIKHSVEATEDEIDALASIIEVAALATYPTTEAQTEALKLAETAFAEELNKLLMQSSKSGQKNR